MAEPLPIIHTCGECDKWKVRRFAEPGAIDGRCGVFPETLRDSSDTACERFASAEKALMTYSEAWSAMTTTYECREGNGPWVPCKMRCGIIYRNRQDCFGSPGEYAVPVSKDAQFRARSAKRGGEGG